MRQKDTLRDHFVNAPISHWLGTYTKWSVYTSSHEVCTLISCKCSDIKWVSWCLSSPANRLLVQKFVLANIKGTSNFCITGLLWGESTGHYCPFVRGIHQWLVVPLTRGQWCKKHFHFMTQWIHVVCLRLSTFCWVASMVLGKVLGFGIG